MTTLPNAQGTIIGPNANFQTVAGNSTTNIYSNSSSEVTLYGRTVRRVIDGDIIFQCVLSSKVLSVNVKPDGISTELQVVKVKRMEQTTKIHGYQGKFTATSFEPVAEKDQEKFKEIIEAVLEAAMCGRSALLKQVFAVAKSNVIILIAYNELTNGENLYHQYRGKEWIIFYYLNYTHATAIQSLHADRTLKFLVTRRYCDWSLNLKTLSWQYDPTSLSLNPPREGNLLPILFPLPPLHQEKPLRLNTTEIIAFVERSLGDVLYLIASYRRKWITGLSNFTRHGLLAFGTVISWRKHKILAHLPSTSPPSWFCTSHSPDITAKYSSSGWVNFLFQKTGDVKVTLDFGWRIPENNRRQLHCAFFCQSIRFCDGSEDVRDIEYIDQVGFRLEGTFPNHPTSCSTPAYLFVHPLPTEFINNAYCVHYPFPKKLFYWSHDQQGRSSIAEEDWKKFRIPKLSMKRLIGTHWGQEHYATVREHLHLSGYNLDGRQYAHDHGHPELIFADSHKTTRVEEPKDLESQPETSLAPSHFASSSTPSPMDTPVTLECNNTSTLPLASKATHWARPGFLKKFYDLVSENVTHVDDLGYSVAAC